MSKYIYKKTSPKRFKNPKKLAARLVGAASLLIGFVLLAYFFFPLLSYQLFLAPVIEASEIEVPIPKYLVKQHENGLDGFLTQGISALVKDYTDARNWYPDVPSVQDEKLVESYTLSIPKLKIDNAVVRTNDYALSKHLVHYSGTSNPGKKGTAVIFGHSTLPQLFNQKDYKTIFATLHTLENGDEFYITLGDSKLKYKIFSITITTPNDVNMFSQSFDNSYITLVTCTPPGTVWKRLVIRASLEGLAT